MCGLDAKIAADDEIALESALLRECTWLEFTQYDEHDAKQHANINGGKFDVFMLGWKLVEAGGRALLEAVGSGGEKSSDCEWL